MTPNKPTRLWLSAAAGILALFMAALPAAGQSQDHYRPSRDRERQQEQRESRDKRDEGRDLFRPGSGKGGDAQGPNTWSIVLLAFRGDNQEQMAQQALTMVQSQWGLQDAYVDKRGQALVIAYGRYGDPQQPEAQADLRRVRLVEGELDGRIQQPFEFAFLAPPANLGGNIPEFDLRNAQKNHGRWAIYTLQIGIYRLEDGKTATASDIAEFRRLAEEAVVQLRREGEQAFYYHGPSGSTVTIGLFGIEDFDPQLRLESPRLRQLRQRFPHNLLNGMGIRRTMRVTDQQGRQVKTERLDPSMLVAVPRI
jgi:hypothetical protein